MAKAINDDIAWLQQATGTTTPAQSSKALAAADGDRSEALRVCIRKGWTADMHLDPDLAGDEEYALTRIEFALSLSRYYPKVLKMVTPEQRRRAPEMYAGMDRGVAAAPALRRMLAGDEPLSAEWLESGRDARLNALMEKHPDRTDPRATYLKAEPFPRLKLVSEGWQGTATLRAWAGFQSRGGGYASRDSAKPSTGRVRLVVMRAGAKGDSPTPAQAAAYQLLKASGAAVRDATLSAALEYYADLHEDLGDDDLPDPADLDAKGMRGLMGLGTVFVMREERDGLAYVGLECGCEWDEEHGFGVMLHGDRVVSAGQADTAFDEWSAKKDAKQARAKSKSR